MIEPEMSPARRRLASLTATKALPEKVGVARVMGELLNAELAPAEREAAEAIVQDLCADTVETVRIALARSVAASPHLPRALAERLAADIGEVSIPVLQLSPVLTDEVLTVIVAGGTPGQVEATARRDGLSEAVSEAIVERRHLPAVTMLVRNKTARIAPDTWAKAIDRYGDDADFARSAETRGGLPGPVAEKLIEAASAHVRAFLVRYLNVPNSSLPTLAAGEVRSSQQRLLPRVVPDTVDPGKYAAILKKHRRLDGSVALKALCSGEFDFLIHALSQMTSLSFAYVQRQLFSSDPAETAEFLARAGIEARLIPVFRSLLEERDGLDLADYQQIALTRLDMVTGAGRARSGEAVGGGPPPGYCGGAAVDRIARDRTSA